MNFPALRDNLARIRDEIAAVQAAEGVSQSVRIIAVTKGHPPDAVRAAASVGLTEVGENRVQEAIQKQEQLGAVPVTWHLIGHLQTNKARFVPGRFALVHSVDSQRVAEALVRAMHREEAGRTGLPPLPVLVQVNVAGESEKAGCAPEVVRDLVEWIRQQPTLAFQGLMTMAPFTDDELVQRKTFRGARQLGEQLEAHGIPCPDLSMGMSGDFRVAVAEGATLLRLGTILFGPRGS